MSEELQPEGSASKKRCVNCKVLDSGDHFLGFACKMSFQDKGLKTLVKKPKKAIAWLSQKSPRSFGKLFGGSLALRRRGGSTRLKLWERPTLFEKRRFGV